MLSRAWGLLLFWAFAGAASAGTFDSGLLWKVEKPGRPPSYLFGTIHSEDPRVTHLPPAVETVFRTADAVALELRLDEQSALAVAQGMFLEPTQSLRQIIPARLYERAVDAMEQRGYPETTVRRLKPWGVMLTLSSPKVRTGRFLDQCLYDAALEVQKPVVGLETAEEQVAVFGDFTPGQQVVMLRWAVAGATQFDSHLETLTQAYLNRDLKRLLQLFQADLTQLRPKLRKKLANALLHRRNARMFERMGPLLKQGNAFIAVGALHLPGKTGLLHRLQVSGYRVTAVY